jgi:predicted ferric reductase
MIKRASIFAIYFLSPFILILAIYFSNTERYGNIKVFVPMMLGAIAYTWLVWEFIIIARPKPIEKYFGMDRLYRFHGLMAVTSVIMVFIHKILMTGLMGEFSTSRMGDKAWLVYIAIVFLALFFMTGMIAQKVKPVQKLREILGRLKITNYNFQVALHNISVIGLILMFLHVMMTYGAKSNLLIKAIYITYFSIGLGFYIYHRFLRSFILSRKKFKVSEVIKEIDNVYTLKMMPEKGSIFSYKPGQFGFLRILGENIRAEEHPFSFSSDPSEKKFLSVTVKTLGDYTSSVKNVKPGYKVFLDGPYGNFSPLNYNGEEGIVLISGGVGITPALSILRYIYKNDIDKRVTLIWGVNNRNEIICSDEFEKMKSDMRNFNFVPVMFKDNTWEGYNGIIDKEKIENILENNGIEISKQGYYICGPGIMLDNVLKALKSMGIKRKLIHFERFSL